MPQKAREGDKIRHSSLSLVNLLSKLFAWPFTLLLSLCSMHEGQKQSAAASLEPGSPPSMCNINAEKIKEGESLEEFDYG